jgi:hypothetical protein
MCKEMPVITVDRVVDKKRIIEKKLRAQEERHKGSLTPPPKKKKFCTTPFIWPRIK